VGGDKGKSIAHVDFLRDEGNIEMGVGKEED